MPAISRLGDLDSGHGCYPPRATVQSSNDVFANGIGVYRQSDGIDTHCCGSSCHSSNCAAGSSTVYVNGLQCARISDPIACGSAMAQGSSDVFAGG